MADSLATTLGETARTLGLQVTQQPLAAPFGLSGEESYRFEGVLDGHLIEASVDLRVQGAGNRVFARAPVDPPLDLGLEISLVGYDHYATPVVTADEPDRAEALLRSGLRAALAPRDFAVSIHDSAVVVGFFDQYGEWRADPAAGLTSLVEWTRELRQRLSLGRPAIPPARALAGHAAAWRALALDRGGAVKDCPLSLACEIPPVLLEGSTRRLARGRHEVLLRARFDPPLGAGLQLHPRTIGERLVEALRGPRLAFADPAFDGHFHAEARDESLARALLSPPVRALLLGLAQQGPTRLDDAQLLVSVPGSLEAPAALQAIEGALAVALALAAAAHGDRGSPYR